MKSPNDVGIPGVVLEPLFWVVEEPAGSVFFLVEVKGESRGVESPVAPRYACWRWGSRPVVSAENPPRPEHDDRDQEDDERNG
jgi:hypothetical protein